MKELNDKLDRHISFIESVYRGLRNPIDRVKNWFGDIQMQMWYSKI